MPHPEPAPPRSDQELIGSPKVSITQSGGARSFPPVFASCGFHTPMEVRSLELTNEMIYELAPYARLLGIEADESSPALVKVRLPHRSELSTIGGPMHGGALMSLCDLGAAICGGLNAPEGHYAATAESTTYFLKPLNGSVAIATARPVKTGRSLICVEVDVHDEAGDHCLRTTQMLAVRDAR